MKLLLVFVIGLATALANPAGQPFEKVRTLPGLLSKQPSVIEGRAACPESYAPCVCDSTSNGLEVTCNNVDVATIKSVFFRTLAKDLYSVSLTATDPGVVALPSDLLDDKVAKRISLSCPVNVVPRLALTIDPATFQYTRHITTHFSIKDCDLSSQTDMSFLYEFDVLDTLRIERSSGLNIINTLPTYNMTALKEVAILDSEGLGLAPSFPILTPAQVERLLLSGNQLNDAQSNKILIAVAGSSSASSLKTLSLSNNNLEVAPQVASFSRLISHDLSGNIIPFIGPSAFIFPSSSLTYLGLETIGLVYIQPGAFVGSYTNAQVNLAGNKLTELNENVFKTMLTQMNVQPPAVGGQLIVTNNPFDCGCGLAWLIRDNPDLLPSVVGGVCGGFFRFEDLNPSAYANC